MVLQHMIIEHCQVNNRYSVSYDNKSHNTGIDSTSAYSGLLWSSLLFDNGLHTFYSCHILHYLGRISKPKEFTVVAIVPIIVVLMLL